MLVLFVFVAVLASRCSPTTADDLDGPVILFTLLAVGISLGVGVWARFFYGWSFTAGRWPCQPSSR